MYYPLSKKALETDERDNMITSNIIKGNKYLIEYSLTPFRTDRSIDIIKKFQESDVNKITDSDKMDLTNLLNECVMRFNQHKINTDFWKNCSVEECDNKCCRSLKSEKCFKHTKGTRWYKLLRIRINNLIK